MNNMPKILNKDRMLLVSHPCFFVQQNSCLQTSRGSQVHGTITNLQGRLMRVDISV